MNDEAPAARSSTRAETEAGRKLFAGEWHFAGAAGSIDVLPPMGGVEIAFAGRSNVGKSSLINALTGRRALARTSNTPGRTQELIFFTGPSKLTLVDMPGYGYAAAAKTKIKAWTTLIHAFSWGAPISRGSIFSSTPATASSPSTTPCSRPSTRRRSTARSC